MACRCCHNNPFSASLTPLFVHAEGMHMKTPKLLIVYASKYGQARKIAWRIGDIAQSEGVIVEVISVEIADEYPLEEFDFLIVAGSVHFGRHPRALEEFVRRKLALISTMQCAFVSVSGSAATPDGREEADGYVHDFARRTGWVPEISAMFSGAEPYTKYGFFTRYLMRSIARKHGRAVDVHRDYEFTDWEAVDRFARDFIGYASAKKSA